VKPDAQEMKIVISSFKNNPERLMSRPAALKNLPPLVMRVELGWRYIIPEFAAGSITRDLNPR
jgi:hypothetical protein